MGFKSLFVNRLNAYIKPYFILCGINLVLCIIQEIIKNGVIADTFSLVGKWIYGILYVYPSVEYMPNCTPLWFLVALFFANIMFYYILELRSTRTQILFIMLFVITDMLLYYIIDFQMIWCMGAILIGTCCMYFGFYIRYNMQSRVASKSIIPILMIIGILSGYVNGRVGVGANNLGRYPLLFWVSALTISLAILLYASILNHKISLLNWFGRNTILFMGFNYFFNSFPEFIWNHVMPFAQYHYPWYIKSFVCALCISCAILVWNKLKTKWTSLIDVTDF